MKKRILLVLPTAAAESQKNDFLQLCISKYSNTVFYTAKEQAQLIFEEAAQLECESIIVIKNDSKLIEALKELAVQYNKQYVLQLTINLKSNLKTYSHENNINN